MVIHEHNKAPYEAVNGRYGTLTIFANDTGAGTQSLLTYGEWAQNEISFLERFVMSGCTVLDVGAYIGTHTLAFARFVGPTGRVIAIEAQPSTFEVLKNNIEANAAADPAAGISAVVQLENAIASHELGQITIPAIDVGHESSFGSASLLNTLTGTPLPVAGSARIALDRDHVCVRAITIDSLDLQNCALIKADVEGVEDMVLRGAVQTLERCSPFVYCECNSLAAGLKSMTVLENVGYKVFAHVVNAFNPDNFFGVQKNIFGDAREVALVGVPAAQKARIRSFSARPFELLLDIKDADDLALALLNKPQYQFEVLRRSRAAQTGGLPFLDQYAASRLELGRLRDDMANLQRVRTEERCALEQRIIAADEEKLAFAKQRDDDIAQLHALLTQRDCEIAQLHALLTQRDSVIELLQGQASGRERDMAELHGLLTQRDTDIARLQSLVAQKDATITSLQTSIEQQDHDISQLRTLLTQRDADISRLTASVIAQHADLDRVNAAISDLCASKSWKITAPLRWVGTRFQRLL
jgi:FkbM family methyltransferase